MTVINNNPDAISQACIQNKAKINQGKLVLSKNGVETVVRGYCRLADGKFYIMKSANEQVLLEDTDSLTIND